MTGAKLAKLAKTAAAAASGSALNLDINGEKASRTSSQEVNATTPSFTPFGPDWSGSSSAGATIDGKYMSSYGDENVRFKVLQGGPVGSDKNRVRVYEQDGQTFQTVTIQTSHDSGRVYTLNNGLKVSFWDGELTQNDEFNVAGSVVDPDKALPACGMTAPPSSMATTTRSPLAPSSSTPTTPSPRCWLESQRLALASTRPLTARPRRSSRRPRRSRRMAR